MDQLLTRVTTVHLIINSNDFSFHSNPECFKPFSIRDLHVKPRDYFLMSTFTDLSQLSPGQACLSPVRRAGTDTRSVTRNGYI